VTVFGLIPPLILFRKSGRFVKTLSGLAGLGIGAVVVYPQCSARLAKDFVQAYEQGTLQESVNKYFKKISQSLTPAPKLEKVEEKSPMDDPKEKTIESKPVSKVSTKKHHSNDETPKPIDKHNEVKAEKHKEKHLETKSDDKHDEKPKSIEKHGEYTDIKHHEKPKTADKHDEHHSKHESPKVMTEKHDHTPKPSEKHDEKTHTHDHHDGHKSAAIKALEPTKIITEKHDHKHPETKVDEKTHTHDHQPVQGADKHDDHSKHDSASHH